MDYLYDKVGFYDTLKPIMQGKASTDTLAPAHAEVLDIEEHMLHFLENHDEQRIASADFRRRREQGQTGDGRIGADQPLADDAVLCAGGRRAR